MENRYEYSDNQRKIIYEQMIAPLKEKISKIVLYDSEAAAIFLQKINEMMNYKSNDKDIISQIVELEFEIKEYQRSNRKGVTSEQVKALLQNIDDISNKIEMLSVKELEDAIKTIEQSYSNNSFEIEDMDEIEGRVYHIKAKILEKMVCQGDTDLTDDISIKDEVGIRVAINEEVAELMKSNSEETRIAANQLRAKLTESKNDIFDAQLYRMLNAARHGVALNPIIEQTTSLVPARPKRGFLTRLKSLIFHKLEVPLKVEDLNKITIDWLSENIPLERLPKDENGATISPKMFILQKWDEYYKKQWDLSKRYDAPPNFEDSIRGNEHILELKARAFTLNWRRRNIMEP